MTAAAPDLTPELTVIVDTEEEFDWRAPFSRSNLSTRSVPAQARAQGIYARMGVVPTYVIGYPIARDPVAVAYLRRLKEEGQAEVGAHLHPWVTPPHHEFVSSQNSYQCNLPPALERRKIETLTEAIESAFGDRPTIFKAGRHGFGPSTARAIAALGYKIDCSLLPHNDLRGDGGPDFRRVRDQPHWIDEAAGLLEIPATTGFVGRVPGLGPHVSWMFDSPRAAGLRIPGLLGRSRIVSRSRLTPEGVPPQEQCRLLDSLLGQGHRTFSLVYHSPSLAPGNTPYVKDEADLARFLASIEEVLTYFRDVIGGRFTTLSAVHARMSGGPGEGTQHQVPPAVARARVRQLPRTATAAPSADDQRAPEGAAGAAATGRGARG
jgi:uncharacterized protein Usg